ncbi:MAG: nucleotidyltransferase domain-containing protein [Bacteroidota bacterium]|nr:nucleotidyltransferase domain-containing protein [Bacteroidota bacterium]
MIKENQIEFLIREIADAYQPEKIYLFGSYATDKPTTDSDIDLFIVKDTTKRKIERSREVRKCIKRYPTAGLDIIVYTPEELKSCMAQTMNIGKEAVTTGKLVYERI